MSQYDKKKWAQEMRRTSESASAAGTSSQTHKRKKKRRRRLNTRGKIIVTAMLLGCVLVLICLVLVVRAACIGIYHLATNHKSAQVTTEETLTEESSEAETEAAPAVEAYDDTITSFNPTCTTDTDPSNMMSTTSIEVDGTVLSSVSDYQSPFGDIEFEEGSKYTSMDGIITFRGNNFRSAPVYGTADITENKLQTIWSQETGSTTYNGKTWNGSGWTGQPLITSWPKEVRQHMNMYEWAKEEESLTEVIYATLDGNIYFLDLATGEPTRDPMDIGFTFKGAGALDPRGYPIMYLGAGYTSNQGHARVFVINLLDCSVMYTFGNDDSFALRGCYFFDSSALVDAETDTLIYPGEDGVLYQIHLNTQYDESAGTLSIDPDHVVKWNYEGKRSSKSSYWLGMEDSACIYKGYMFIADNGGHFMCLNLNTLQLVWVQDTLDDTNCTPVLSVEDGHPYLYISTSFHKGWRANSEVNIPIFKIDAENGSIVWQTEYMCSTVEDCSGGVQSTMALGENSLSDYIYCTVSRTDGTQGEDSKGVLTCLNKKTGEITWEHKAYYAWSSPVCVYNSDGSGKVIYADSSGELYLIDGLTGEQLDSISISDGVIEASPAVYNNTLVLGIRASKIWGISLS